MDNVPDQDSAKIQEKVKALFSLPEQSWEQINKQLETWVLNGLGPLWLPAAAQGCPQNPPTYTNFR